MCSPADQGILCGQRRCAATSDATWTRSEGTKSYSAALRSTLTSSLLVECLQIWGSCVASANTPLALLERGLEQWLQLGVPADKLVLGLPW